MSDYKFLFPFEKVKYKSKILIYGAGMVGQEYFKQLIASCYCEVLAFIDRNYRTAPKMIIPVISLEQVKEYEVDYVVIALRTSIGVEAIRHDLVRQGILVEKIVYVPERITEYNLFIEKNNDVSNCNKLAYDSSDMSVALSIAGGIGDMINQKLLVQKLCELAPESKIDIYTALNENFVKYLYSDTSNVVNVILNMGTKYLQNVKKYTAGLFVDGSTILRLDHLQEDQLKEKYHLLLEIFIRIKRKENIPSNMPNFVLYYRNIYSGYNCRDWFIEEWGKSVNNVSIPFTYKGEQAYRKYGLDKYITLNYGAGNGENSQEVAKMWPAKNYEDLVKLLKSKYPWMTIIQLGSKSAKKIVGVDKYFLGEDFEVVTYILKNAIFHFDIEGGLVHWASHLETKCIVLFGQTQLEYFGYDNNINIRAGNCHGCNGLYSDIDKCARGLSEPECMYSITPEMVMGRIDDYVAQQNLNIVY